MSYIKEKIEKLRELRKVTKDVRMHTKLLFNTLHKEGYQDKQIAKIVYLDEHTVGTYIKNYLNNIP